MNGATDGATVRLDQAHHRLRDTGAQTCFRLAESRRAAGEEQLAADSMPHFNGTGTSPVIGAPPVRIHGASMLGSAYCASTPGLPATASGHPINSDAQLDGLSSLAVGIITGRHETDVIAA
jgi:hypothetical protein